MEKTKKKKRCLLIIITVSAIGILLWLTCTKWIPRMKIKKESSAFLLDQVTRTVTETIKKHSGEVLVAQSDTKQLFVDTDTCDLRIKDITSGISYHAIYPKKSSGAEKSLVSVTFLGEDNVLSEWDSYQYCISQDAYEVSGIENGVKITLHMSEEESLRLYEYMPQKMSIERYEQYFVQGLKDLAQNQTMDAALAEKYLTTLSLIYVKSEADQCYAVNYIGTPPTSAVKQLIEITKAVGYTNDMLLADCQDFGLTPASSEKAKFTIVIDAYLDQDDLIVSVPALELINENEYFQISNIKVLPNFMTATAAETEEGYLFVPDGSGALIQMYQYDTSITDYKRPIYDNNYYSDYFFAPAYKETLHMPVYGMFYGSLSEPKQGFLAIIESGAETSYIHAKTGAMSTEDGGSPYNKVYASMDLMQKNSVKVFGPYSDSAATYLVKTNPFCTDYRVRFRLFSNDGGYFQMAKSYQQYLKQTLGITKTCYLDHPELYLNMIGTVSITKHLLGIPYQTYHSMTTYNELSDLLDQMKDYDLTIEYDGALNGGMNNEVANQASLVSANGTHSEYDALVKKASELDVNLFLGVNFLRIYSDKNGYQAKSKGTYNYYSEPALCYRYFLATGNFNQLSYPYSILQPLCLSSVVDSFLADSKHFNQIAVRDLACDYLADYHEDAMISPYEASEIVNRNLTKLSKEKNLSLTDPRMNEIGYGSYAVGIDRKSSNYASFYETIPFRQLVMNGLITYTTSDVNMNSNDLSYYLLQTMELGSIPKFTLTAKSADDLRDTYYSYLYSTEFDEYQDKMKTLYDAVLDVCSRIGSFEISNHEILSQGVYRTTYASGDQVIVNYNDYEVTLEECVIPAKSYEWRKIG